MRRQPLIAKLAGDKRFVRPCDQHILETLLLVEKMLHLADKGDEDREDIGCGILYGILRDAAYKVKKVAEKEWDIHLGKKSEEEKIRAKSLKVSNN